MNEIHEKAPQPAKRKRLISLRKAIILAVTFCWLLPTILIIAILAGVSSGNRITQIEEVVEASGDSAFDLFISKLESSLEASRSASYTPTVRDSYLQHLEDDDDQLLYESIMNFLSQQYGDNEHILCSMIFFSDDPYNLYFNYNRSAYSNLSIYKSSVHNGVLGMSKQLGTDIDFVQYGQHVYLIRNLMFNNFDIYGMVVLELDMENILSSLDSIAWHDDVSVRLGDLYVDSGDSAATRDHIPTPDEPVWAFSYTDKDHSYVCDYARLAGTPVAYAAAIDASDMLDTRETFVLLFFVTAAALIPLLFFIFIVVHRIINRPISQMVAAYKHIEDGELGYQTPVSATVRELDYLIGSFNDMSSRLSDLFERLYREDLALRDARIMALQSQINPHFLNNTLEIINWEARFAGDEKVTKMIEALSTMLEAAMDRKKRPLVQLREELTYIDAYLYIITERFGKRLTIEKDIDSQLLAMLVPRLVLQPILENAIEHGIQPRNSGTVSIHIFRDADYLKISVINDSEMSEEDQRKVEQLLTHEPTPGAERAVRLGIRNVNERIRILYGQDCGLIIRPTPDGKTETLLKMHLITDKAVSADNSADAD